MMDTVAGPLFNPDLHKMLAMILRLVSISFILTILFLALVTIKIDDYVAWSWAAVWIPAWIANILVVYMMFKYFLQIFDDDEEEDNNEDEKDNTDQTKRLKQYNKFFLRIKKFIMLFKFSLVVLFQIFIVIKLDGKVTWTACVVLIPYFVYEGTHFFITCLKTLVGCLALASVLEKGKIPYFIFSQFWLAGLRFSFFLLVALRIDLFIKCSWGAVFIPLYLIGLKWAIELVYRYIAYSRMPQQEVAHQGKVTVLTGIVVFIIVGLLFYALIGLTARRLDGLIYVKMSNVFVPLFIVLVGILVWMMTKDQQFNYFSYSRFYCAVLVAVFRV